MMEGADFTLNGIFHLPWEDILCKKVLCLLSIEDICRLQMVNKTFTMLVEIYFKTCHAIDLSKSGTKNSFCFHHFERITRNCEKLRELNLQMCKKWLQDQVLVPVLERNTLLRNIDISGCLDVTNNAMRTIASSCKGLQTLVLQECRWLESDALKMIGTACHNLQFLSLLGCWNINNDSLCTVFMNNKFLRHVDVGHCYGVDSSTISYLAKKCREINFLGIKGCCRVKNDAVQLIGEYCKCLRELHVKDCKEVTEASLAILRVHGVTIDVSKPKYSYRAIFDIGEPFNSRPSSIYPQI